MIKVLLASIFLYEGVVQGVELNERRKVFKQARDYADSVSKSLLVVGAPKDQFNHACGDVTIDISPKMARFCNGEIADVRDIPYQDKYFGAAYASHILEHLETIEDACQALAELDRVADRSFVVLPHKASIMAWLNPNHHLWLTPESDGYIIEQRGLSA